MHARSCEKARARLLTQRFGEMLRARRRKSDEGTCLGRSAREAPFLECTGYLHIGRPVPTHKGSCVSFVTAPPSFGEPDYPGVSAPLLIAAMDR